MKRILAAVDGSDAANRAAAFAARLARETDAALTLIHVYDAPTAVLLGLEAQSAEEVHKTKEILGKGSFDGARRAIGELPITLTTHAGIGHPAPEIVAYAKANQVDLIVVGSQGRSNLESVLLGSVSDYVVRHASCPVTVVR